MATIDNTYNAYFTRAGGTKQLATTSDTWKQVQLLLDTVGPVVVGNQENLQPVTSGKGMLLTPGVPMTWVMPPQSRLYIASTAINRVNYIVTPLAYEAYLQAVLAAIGASTSPTAPAPGGSVNIGGFGFKGTSKT